MEKEKKKFKSQSYEKKKPHIKTSRDNAKKDGKIKFEITGLKEIERANFTALRDILNVTNPVLLLAMIEYCKDSNEFKRYVIDKEYLEKKPEVFII